MRAAQDVDVLSRETDPDRGRRPLVVALAATAVVIALDQLTKAWAERALEAGPCGPHGEGCIGLVGTLRLHLVYNSGAAFSTGETLGPVFGVIALVMSVVLLRMAARRQGLVWPVVLGSIAGGALGNLVDRLVRAEDGFLSGSVVDFIDAQWWPVFNVADMAVVLGVVTFALLAMREPVPDQDDEVAATVGDHDVDGDRPTTTP